jgi:hypothetical protein
MRYIALLLVLCACDVSQPRKTTGFLWTEQSKEPPEWTVLDENVSYKELPGGHRMYRTYRVDFWMGRQPMYEVR